MSGLSSGVWAELGELSLNAIVSCFSFRPESLLLKDYCDGGIPGVPGDPRLIAGTPEGESQENSRGTWGPSLSNVHVATLNCHCVCCLGNKAWHFRDSWSFLDSFEVMLFMGTPVRNRVYQPVCSTCQLPLNHTHPQDMDSLLQIFSPRPPSFFYCLIPSLQVPGFQHLHSFHLTNTSSEKITCWTHWQGTNGWSSQISKGACNSPGSRKYMPRIQASPRATDKCVGTVESLSILSARGMVIPGFACLEGTKTSITYMVGFLTRLL